MRYLMAFLFPPVAVLSCGRPGAAFVNLILWLCLIVPGIIHGLMEVNRYYADRRVERLIHASKGKG